MVAKKTISRAKAKKILRHGTVRGKPLTPRAKKFLGVHFFNPVPLMRLVEVIKGDETSDETMDVVAAWAEGLPCRGKRYVPRVLKDRPGFLANRMIFVVSVCRSSQSSLKPAVTPTPGRGVHVSCRNPPNSLVMNSAVGNELTD